MTALLPPSFFDPWVEFVAIAVGFFIVAMMLVYVKTWPQTELLSPPEWLELHKLRRLKAVRGLSGDESYVLEMRRLRELEQRNNKTIQAVKTTYNRIQAYAEGLDSANFGTPQLDSTTPADWWPGDVPGLQFSGLAPKLKPKQKQPTLVLQIVQAANADDEGEA
jgi:hypothetical protein